MESDQKKVSIRLNPTGILVPLQLILKECSESILYGLQTSEMVSSIPDGLKIDNGFVNIQIGQEEIPLEKKKQSFVKWLIKKGFEDLIKAIESTLKEAYFYILLVSKGSQLKTVGDFDKNLFQIRKELSKMHIPELINKIEPYLSATLIFKKEILSINKCRNCLVHRNGIVTDKDINEPTLNNLVVSIFGVKVFYEKNEAEIEVNQPTMFEAGAELKMRMEKSNISFKLGEPILFNYRQFNDCINTCLQFGNDLVNALPKILAK